LKAHRSSLGTLQLEMARTVVFSSAALALAAAGVWWLRASGGNGEDEDDEESTCSKDEVLQFFAELQRQMPEKMDPIMQQIQMIKAQKPDLDMAMLTPQIASHFDKSLLQAQAELLAEMDVPLAEIDAATHGFMDAGDGDVLAAVAKFRALYTGFGGKVEVNLPADLDEAKMSRAYDAWAEARDKGSSATVAEVRKGFVSEAQMRVLKAREVALMDEALKKFGLDEMVFSSALQHFMKVSPTFKAKVYEDSQEQAELEKKTANQG